MRGARAKGGRLARCCALLAVLGGAAAVAGKVEDLSRALLEDGSYKVRVQAALLLGKLGDQAGVPALVKALGDENRTVRAMAAEALGQMAAPSSAEALRDLLKREPDGFVRSQAERALKNLAFAQDARQRPSIFLAFGPFTGGTKKAGPEHARLVQERLRKELGKLPTVTLDLPAGVDERSFQKTGLLGFLIDGSISRLDDVAAGPSPETSCDVKVMVARWPSKSIILWTNAGAGVQAGSRPQDRADARRDCLDASAGQLGQDLAKFLKSQGDIR